MIRLSTSFQGIKNKMARHNASKIHIAILAISSVLTVVLSTSVVKAAEPGFEQRHVFTVDRDMSSMVLGDIDGDGDLDIISGSKDQQNTIYLNENDNPGNFIWENSRRQFGDGSEQTKSIAVGDIDGDGDLDIVAGNSQQKNSIYLNDGSGNFDWEGSVRRFGADDAYTSAVALGDVNGDGFLDIAVGSNLSSTARDNPDVKVALYFNDGSGNFGWNDGTHLFGHYMNAVEDIKIGDINGDTYLDIIVGQFHYNYSRNSMIYLNDGGGNFDSPDRSYSFDNRRWSIALDDLNHNGYADFVIGMVKQSNGDNGIAYYLTDGVNVPGRRIVIDVDIPDENRIYHMAVGDLSGNGSPDIVVGTDAQNRVLLNDGNGSFQWNRYVAYGPGKNATTLIVLGDVNRDGYLDIVDYTNKRGIIYFNNGSGNFSNENTNPIRSTTIFEKNESGLREIVTADINGDGYLDVVTANWRTLNKIYFNDGTGQLGGEDNSFAFGLDGEQTYSIAVGDLDSNGCQDVVTGNLGEQNVIYLNEKDTDNGCRFIGNDNTRLFGTGKESTFAIAIGDMNNDEHIDIVAGNFMQQGVIYLNDGTGNFLWEGSERTFGTGDRRTMSVAVGDLDRDGDLDILAGNSEQQSEVYFNDGNGNFDWPGSVHIIGSNPYGTFSVALGDMNGDGYLDAVVANNTQQVFYIESHGNFDYADGVANDQGLIFINDRTGRFDEKLTKGFGSWSHEINDVALVDIDGDRDLDIVTGYSKIENNHPEPSNTIFLNDGLGNFSINRLRTLQRNPNKWQRNPQIAVGDMDRDGDIDIVAGGNDKQNIIYLNHIKPGKMFTQNGKPMRYSTIQHPLVTIDPNFISVNANHFSTSTIIDGRYIPITYTLTLTGSNLVGRIAAYYSLDGGGRWLPADGTTETRTSELAASERGVTHVYTWDTFESGIFGQSDNVVIRLEAYPQPAESSMLATYRYTNTVPGPYQWPYAATNTFPFRLRGTQIRVVDPMKEPVSNARVFRLPASSSSKGELMGPPHAPYSTSESGFLAGRDELKRDDELFALVPITSTDVYTFYFTNSRPISVGLEADLVTKSGVQPLTVTSEYPLILFDLTVSLEWDASNDPIFQAQLKENLQRTSEALYDWTNGQIALGNVTVYQEREKWEEAHIQILASNQVRPVAHWGGIVESETPIIFQLPSEVISKTATPGKIRIGPTWNRYGRPAQSIGDDWPNVLAHELGHLMLYLEDAYLGNEKGLLIPVDGCKETAMSDPYIYSEFLDARGWTDECKKSLAILPDWDVITQNYRDLHAPTSPNQGPASMPFALTKVGIQRVSQSSEHPLLEDTNIQLDDPNGLFSQGRAYLVRSHESIVDLGRPVGNLIRARGAREIDEVCIFAPSAFDCEELRNDSFVQLEPQTSPWQPEVELSFDEKRNLELEVTDIDSNQITATVYPGHGQAPPKTYALQSGIPAVISFTKVISNVFIDIVGDDPNTQRIITGYTLGGGPGKEYSHGGPLASPDGGVSVLSPDNQGDDDILAMQIPVVQPSLPDGPTVIGRPYRFFSSDKSLVAFQEAGIMFQYLELDVLQTRQPEDSLEIYYWEEGDEIGRRLTTTLGITRNFASALMPGPGTYMLGIGTPKCFYDNFDSQNSIDKWDNLGDWNNTRTERKLTTSAPMSTINPIDLSFCHDPDQNNYDPAGPALKIRHNYALTDNTRAIIEIATNPGNSWTQVSSFIGGSKSTNVSDGWQSNVYRLADLLSNCDNEIHLRLRLEGEIRDQDYWSIDSISIEAR